MYFKRGFMNLQELGRMQMHVDEYTHELGWRGECM